MIEFVSEKEEKLSKAVLSKTFLKYGEVLSLIKKKDIKVNGKRISKDVLIGINDKITVYADVSAPKNQLYEDVYEDGNILIVDKFKGVNSDKLFEYLQEKQGELYYIHRLDLNTDGLIVFAKNPESEAELLKGFKDRTFDKYYYALVYGAFDKKTGVLSDYLVKDEASATVKIYSNRVNGSVNVITEYKEVARGENTSLLEVRLITGKTHQIRAHLAFYGHFIMGDYKYGNGEISRVFGVKKQQLTSRKIVFSFTENSPLFYLNNKTFAIDKKPKLL